MQFTTADNKVVHIDESGLKHLAAHPDVSDLLPEAISKMVIGDEEDKVQQAVEMGRVVGRAGIVDTLDVTLDTPIHFAFRAERPNPTPVVLEGEGKESSTVAVSVYFHKESGQWRLITAFIGVPAPNEPFRYFDKNSWFYKNEARFKLCLDFWMKHALVYEPEISGEPFESTWRAELEKAEKKFLLQ